MARFAARLLFLACIAWGFGSEVAGGEPVRSTETISTDGADLHLELRGADRDAPVWLWLHGGPGGAERPLFRYYDAALEDRFVVVYWDQRGAGRSFDPDADPAGLTIARHLADLRAVCSHLEQRLGTRDLVLAGHSWGGALALLYTRDHPDEVAAVVGVSPLIAPRASQQAEYDFVVAEAARRGDDDALTRAREVGPPPYDDAAELLSVERLADRYGAVFHRRPNRMALLVRGIAGGFVTPWEIPRMIRGNEVSLAAMHEELDALDLRVSVPSVAVPVVFALGRHDRHVSAEIAARYFETLRAPAKRLLWFEQSAHNVPFEEPERFVGSVVGALSSFGVGRAP